MEATFVALNKQFEQERRDKTCGSAIINIRYLKYYDAFKSGTKQQQKHAASLHRILHTEQYSRCENERNHIVALIDQSILDEALKLSNLSISSLASSKPPYKELQLPQNVQLEVLQGANRLVNVKQTSRGQGSTWVVDLILDSKFNIKDGTLFTNGIDISIELKALLKEDYNYQKSYADGEIYYHIRRYTKISNDTSRFFLVIWWGRLSANKSKHSKFKQLMKKEQYITVLDEMMHIPALLSGLRLSVIHEVFRMGCDELHLTYLSITVKWWKELCCNDETIMVSIERSDVELIQGKAPGALSYDHDELLALYDRGVLFGNVSAADREKLWQRLCSATEARIAPSLFTFFEDYKFLKEVADSLKSIMELPRSSTITTSLKGMFTDIGQYNDKVIIQRSRLLFETISGTKEMRMSIGILQVWLAAMRIYEYIPSEPRKKALVVKARSTVNKLAVYELAYIAYRLGFESDRIHTILGNAAIAGEFNLSLIVQQTDNNKQESQFIAIKRHGTPFIADHNKDKEELFLGTLSSLSIDSLRTKASLFIRKSVITAYFNDLPAVDLAHPGIAPAFTYSELNNTEENHFNRDIIQRGMAIDSPNAEDPNQYTSQLSSSMFEDYSDNEILKHEQPKCHQCYNKDKMISNLQYDKEQLVKRIEKLQSELEKALMERPHDLQEQPSKLSTTVNPRPVTHFEFHGSNATNATKRFTATFIVYQDDNTTIRETKKIGVMDEKDIEKIVVNYLSQGYLLFDGDGNNLQSHKCFGHLIEGFSIIVKKNKKMKI